LNDKLEELARQAKIQLEGIQEQKAVFWAFEQVDKMFTTSEVGQIRSLAILGKITPEQIDRIVKLQKERMAIRALLLRLSDYIDKRDAAHRVWFRTGQYKWLHQANFYTKSIQEIRGRLGNIYRKKMEPLRELERQCRSNPELARSLYVYAKFKGWTN
jgi:hypothetical protein